jgi:hypothetical protein
VTIVIAALLTPLLLFVSWGDFGHRHPGMPRTITGTWASDRGQVTLLHGPVEDNKPVVVNGYYMMGDTKAHITRGTFDPADGAFEFLFWEPKRKITGSAKLQLSANGMRLEGTWSNSASERGIWTMIHVTP